MQEFALFAGRQIVRRTNDEYRPNTRMPEHGSKQGIVFPHGIVHGKEYDIDGSLAA